MVVPDAAALAERLVESTTGALELFSVHLGRELGLYRSLVDDGPATAALLAGRTGVDERYAREWLEQQAVAGLLRAGDHADDAAREYALPDELRPVLVDPEDPLHVGPMADLVAGIAGVLHRLPGAYRDGAGVAYEDYGSVFRRGQGGINRPAFVHELPDWLAALGEEAPHHTRPEGVRVADVGCGEGWSTIALARHLPAASVHGYDIDEASVAVARQHAAAAGVDDRVTFHLVDAADPDALAGPYDLACVFEALHDAARPVELLATIHRALADDGLLLVADERVAEAFTPEAGDVERLMYGWSVLHCLPAALASTPSAALGTVLRPGQVRRLADEAGFAVVDELELENDFFRFYRLRP